MLEFSKILEHFEHLYGHLPLPILVVDMHRIVRKANKAFCRLFEQDPDEAAGHLADECLERPARFSAATIPAPSAGILTEQKV
jgi:PAS domain-containing protein